MILRVKDVSVARGGVAVLEGLSFEIAPSHALILKGPNGVGKTTLLRTVAGLQPPFKGEVDATEAAVAYADHSDGLKALAPITH